MKRSSLYFVLWLCLLGLVVFIHKQQKERANEYRFGLIEEREDILRKVKQNNRDSVNTYVLPGHGKIVFDSTFVVVEEDNQYLIIDSITNLIYFVKIKERKDDDSDSVELYFGESTFFEGDDIEQSEEWLMKYRQKIKKHHKTFTLVSKNKLEEHLRGHWVHLSRTNYGAPNIPSQVSWISKVISSSISDSIALIIFFLIILFFDKIGNYFVRLFQIPKWKILLGLAIVIFFIQCIFVGNELYRVYNPEKTTIIDWLPTLFLFRFGFVLMFPAFYFFKKKYLNHLGFADREAIKYGFLFLIGTGMILINAYITSRVVPIDYSVIWYTVPKNWLTLELVLPFWFFANANFLNNFRKHFFQLKNKEAELEIAQVKELETSSELEALQSKVNPHFLYNSLNSIASLAKEDPAKTEAMAMALSKFYKYSTNRQDELWTTVASEIEMLEIYLEIEKIRFGERLQVNLNIDETTKDIKLPRFLLQPLLENAIKYGYNEKLNQTNVHVITEKKDNQLHVNILDEGKDFSEEMNVGYGLRSVQKKLKLLYPEKYELAFVNQPQKGVFITIEL